jgi:hypothetical protein
VGGGSWAITGKEKSNPSKIKIDSERMVFELVFISSSFNY